MDVVAAPEWDFRHLGDALKALDLKPRGIVHIGAHHGEEVPTYRACGFASITLVEADLAAADVAARLPGVVVIHVACAPEAGTATFHTAGGSVWGSLRDPAHGADGQVQVQTLPAAQLQGNANVMVIDTQGTELDVLRSAALDSLDLVIIETQHDSPDAYGAYWPDLIALLDEVGWRAAIQWDRGSGWADTLVTPTR